MISGNSVIFQIGAENTYGSSAVASEQIRISSESFKPTYNKVAEGLATGGKGAGKVQTMGIKAGGNFSTLLRPDMELLLKCLMGVQTLGDNGEKIFTAIGTGLTDHLPSFTVYVDRKVNVFAYPGTKINSMNFSAEAGNYVSIDVECTSKTEAENATLADVIPSNAKAFRFASGAFRVNGEKLADVTSFSMNYNNNLASDVQTSDTGDYYKEPECGTREISGELTMDYASGAENFRKNYYKTDDTFSLELRFAADNIELKIEIPACQLTDASANMGSPTDFLNQSNSWNAVEDGENEYITMTLTVTE